MRSPPPPPDTRAPTHDTVTVRNPAKLGELLRERRKARGWSMKEAAAAARCSVQFVFDLEAGKATAQFGKALAYARTLGVELFAR